MRKGEQKDLINQGSIGAIVSICEVEDGEAGFTVTTG